MLKEISKKQLLELKEILNQISDSDYPKPLTILENGTLGKHVRHILEFYQCLLFTNSENIICYDDRKRNLLLEDNVRYATDYIDEIIDRIELIELNSLLSLKSKYEDAEILIETSLYRELIYNVEHTVHHLATIRIAISSELKYINLSNTFGYSESTIQFLNTKKVAN
jgi:hypothetical protein